MSETPAPNGQEAQSDFETQYQRILEAAECKTQVDIAAVLEVCQSSVSKVRQRRSIPSSWFLKLFEKKRINPEWIRTGQGEKNMSATGNAAPKTSTICLEDEAAIPTHHIDNFAKEQETLANSLQRLKVIGGGMPRTPQQFAELSSEYNQLLKWVQDATTLTDAMCRKIHELQHLIQQDPLTGIHNRRYLEENLDRIVKTLLRSDSELGILMIDVDNFKQYNDIYGHSMGDVALRKVAASLKKSLARADDFVVRYGGEEFTVVLPNTGEQGARIMAHRMLTSIRERNIPYEHKGFSSCVTVSVGATSGKVTSARSRNDFIKLADKALYKAKSNGRNTSVFLGFE